MNTEITPEQATRYAELGYHLQEDFLSPAELDRWRNAVEAAVGRRSTTLPTRNFADVSDYYANTFVQRTNLFRDAPDVAQLVVSEPLGEMVANLTGLDAVRVWQDQALIKKPWANATSWHLDNPYFSFHSRTSVSIWIALDDATVQNGCLYFLPGTHRLAGYDNVKIGHNLNALFETYPAFAAIEPAVMEMRAGSCSFHNGLLAHAAGPNMTTRERRAMTIAFMSDDELFNGQQNVLTPDEAAAYQIGDPIRNDSHAPLIFRRTAVNAGTVRILV